MASATVYDFDGEQVAEVSSDGGEVEVTGEGRWANALRSMCGPAKDADDPISWLAAQSPYLVFRDA